MELKKKKCLRMAPESLIERKYSAKSDVWSYGVTIWEMLARQEPCKSV